MFTSPVVAKMKLLLVLFIFSTSTTNLGNCRSKSANLELLILHNSDMHGRFEETSALSGKCHDEQFDSCVGGFARVAHVVRAAREAVKNKKRSEVLYLNADDTYTGTPWFTVHRWKIVAEFLNLLQPDAVSFGNHEFDDGIAGVLPYIQAAKFPIVASNLNYSKEPRLQKINLPKSIIVEVAGRKVGIIGYLTTETAHISNPEGLIFKEEIASIKEESKRLDAKGVNIVIALGHSGFELDKKIAAEVPLVDLVVGGHTNTFLWNGPKPDLEEPEGVYPTVVQQRNGKRVPVVQAYAYTKYLGHLTVVFDCQGNVVSYHGQPLLLDNSVPQEQDVLKLLDKYRSKVDALDSSLVGQSRVTLEGGESCRLKECNFGNLITDAFVAYHAFHFRGSFWTDAPIAIINGGSIRNTIEPRAANNSITRGELLGALPFENTIFSLILNGSDLLKTLEIGARSNGKTSRGELIQASGIRYTIDMSKPIGSRVVQAKARYGLCSIPVYEPIVPRKAYRIITTEFLNNGGDAHTVIKEKGYDKNKEDLNDVDLVVWYIRKFGPVYTEEEERLVVYRS